MSKEKPKGIYIPENFRSVKHGVEERGYSSHCRMCSFSGVSNSPAQGRNHAKQTLHTVDVYKSTHTEYTCWTRSDD